jgi:hypothetical protein
MKALAAFAKTGRISKGFCRSLLQYFFYFLEPAKHKNLKILRGQTESNDHSCSRRFPDINGSEQAAYGWALDLSSKEIYKPNMTSPDSHPSALILYSTDCVSNQEQVWCNDVIFCLFMCHICVWDHRGGLKDSKGNEWGQHHARWVSWLAAWESHPSAQGHYPK